MVLLCPCHRSSAALTSALIWNRTSSATLALAAQVAAVGFEYDVRQRQHLLAAKSCAAVTLLPAASQPGRQIDRLRLDETKRQRGAEAGIRVEPTDTPPCRAPQVLSTFPAHKILKADLTKRGVSTCRRSTTGMASFYPCLTGGTGRVPPLSTLSFLVPLHTSTCPALMRRHQARNVSAQARLHVLRFCIPAVV